MKNFVLSAIVAVGLVGFANQVSAADLLFQSEPIAPAQTFNKNYVGVSLGFGINRSKEKTFGVVVGRELQDNLAVELDYDHVYEGRGDRRIKDRVTGNVVVQQHLGVITPYAFAGTGLGWSSTTTYGVWSVGGGARVHLTETLDLDARFKHTESFGGKDITNSFGGGINARF